MAKPFIFETRSECPVCGAADYETMVRCSYTSPEMREYLQLYYGSRIDIDALGNGDYHLARCLSCKACFQVQVLGPEGMQVLYEEWIDPAASHDKAKAIFDVVPHTFATQAFRFGSLIGKKPGEAWVLDFGCGWGQLLETARASGYNVVGIELSPARLAFLRERGITCHEGTDGLGQKFDFVNCSQVLEHVSNPLEILLAIKSVCAPGAIVQVATPDIKVMPETVEPSDFVVDGELNSRLKCVSPLEHINGYSPRNLVELAARAGFSLSPQPSTDYVQMPLRLRRMFLQVARAYARKIAYRINPLRTTNLYFRA